ncbi:hypothetical protein MRX96_017835 [Rhipicephalus microplus]
MQLCVLQKPASATYPDIREFMMNPPRTWTYNATLNFSYSCKLDVAINKSGRDIYFNQSAIEKTGIIKSGIRIGHTYQSYDLSGRPWNVMFITDLDLFDHGPHHQCLKYKKYLATRKA